MPPTNKIQNKPQSFAKEFSWGKAWERWEGIHIVIPHLKVLSSFLNLNKLISFFQSTSWFAQSAKNVTHETEAHKRPWNRGGHTLETYALTIPPPMLEVPRLLQPLPIAPATWLDMWGNCELVPSLIKKNLPYVLGETKRSCGLQFLLTKFGTWFLWGPMGHHKGAAQPC